MALISALGSLLALMAFIAAEACLGAWLLRKLRMDDNAFSEFFLLATASGVILTEFLLFLALWTQQIRVACIAVLVLLLVPLAREFVPFCGRFRRAFAAAGPFSLTERLLLSATIVTLLIEALASLAPLTGSDAMHYHFTVPRLFLVQGFHPVFSITNSFTFGQNHLLILLGLALGSDSIATAFLYAGGALSALGVYCLARSISSRAIALSAALVFLLTPLVFWQITASGSPDIWMAVFAIAAMLVLTDTRAQFGVRHALLAGFLAGGIAGSKYTGCFVAASLLLAFLVESRSLSKAAWFFSAAVLAGIWPFLRNFLWTGDPLYPFLFARFAPERLNSTALASLLGDTGAGQHHALPGLLPFVLFSGFRPGFEAAFFEFYGPLILALLPLLLLALRNRRPWRVTAIVWTLSAACIYFASGLTRFLLPIFPVALACSAWGLASALRKGWRAASLLASLCMGATCVAGFAGLLFYTRPALRNVLGVSSPDAYLASKAPDYEISRAVNHFVGQSSAATKTLVFYRHTYYLRVPFLSGNPETSMEVDPALLKTPGDWIDFLQREHVTYVVRAPDYPAAIADPLRELEAEGWLEPALSATVTNFRGNRSANDRLQVPVYILHFGSSPTRVAR